MVNENTKTLTLQNLLAGLYTFNLRVTDDDGATDDDDAEEEDMSVETNTPFIGVASQSRSRSVLTYYGIENHAKWLFTPLFRGAGATSIRPGRGPTAPPRGRGF